MSIASLYSELTTLRRTLPSHVTLHVRSTPVNGFSPKQIIGAMERVRELYSNHGLGIYSFNDIPAPLQPLVKGLLKQTTPKPMPLEPEETAALARGWDLINESKVSPDYAVINMATAIEFAIGEQVSLSMKKSMGR